VKVRQVVVATHPGRREHNEDAVLALPQVPVVAVADGMGGPDSGDRAAQMAVEVIRRASRSLQERNATIASTKSTEDRLALGRLIDQVFNRANQEIQEFSHQHSRPGMGSTLVLATFVSGRAFIAHVGDSRAYVIRGGQLVRLTNDHTLAELNLRRGRIGREEYEKSPDRRVLYQALGAGVEVDVDLAEVRLTAGDLLLLCSDGLTRALHEDAIAANVRPGDLQGSADRLVEMSLAAGAPDNVTLVLLNLEPEDGDEPIEAVTEVMRQVFLFRQMSQPDLLTIAPYLEDRVFEKDEVICSEGEPADEFFVLVSGRVRVTTGTTHLVDVSRGGHFGELALARPSTRSATVKALTPTRLLALSRERFQELCRNKPELGNRLTFALLDTVGDRLRDLTERLAAVERAARGTLR
jgi:serine/threonine protein phosphatase PrpC